MKRPCCRGSANPAWVSSFRWNESVLAGMSKRSAIVPAAMPSGPACTSKRNISRRASWAIDASNDTANLLSIFLYFHNYGNNVKQYFPGKLAYTQNKLKRSKGRHVFINDQSGFAGGLYSRRRHTHF